MLPALALRLSACLSICLPVAASAGVERTVNDYILPGLATFSQASARLKDTAAQDCTPEAVKPAWNDAYDAWMGISHLRFGPMETDGRALAISFWPDSRGMVPRTVKGMIADEDPAVDDPEEFADVSIAGRGLMAMERMLYEDDLSAYEAGSYTCRYMQAAAADLARMATELETDWRDGFAETVLHAGDPGNTTYLSEHEATQALYTALTTGIEFTAGDRLGLPMGTFDRPRPERAEARRSGRSRRNIVLSLEALRDMARALAIGEIPRTEEAFAAALDKARELEDPTLGDVSNPMSRLKVEIVMQRTAATAGPVANEIGVALGVSAGFNASDGD